MKVLVTGASGQVGCDVVEELNRRSHHVIPFAGRSELDISDRSAVLRAFEQFRPDAVINCAAWAAVDAAEEPENREAVRAANALGPANLGEACRSVGARLLHLSTDYVFDGQGVTPWTPDCENYSPLNFYGLTKLEGERAVRAATEKHFIVRIAWAFGANGKNFVKTMLNLAKNHDSVRVVNDQIGTPTYTRDLARLLVDMIETEKYGTYHATNGGGYISWCEFCREIYRRAGVKTEVIPVTTAEYGLSGAARPFNSRLDKSKLVDCGFAPLPDWRDALGRYLTEIGERA